MADRYWVGGSGTWNTTSTTNWSTQSGGSGGASVPTVSDSVFFDQSGTYTVTMTGALACLDFNVSAGTVTFQNGTTPSLNVRGSWSTVAATVWNTTGTITFSATTSRTITSNGITIRSPLTFNGTGGTWTLQDNLSVIPTVLVTLTAGTLALSTYTLTAGVFASSGSTARTLNFDTGKIVLNGTAATTVWNTGTVTNLTILGTPLIECQGGGTGVTKTISTGALSEANSVSISLLETSGTVTYSITGNIKDLLVNGSQTIANTSFWIYGNFTHLTTNGTTTFTAGANAWIFTATSGTRTLGFLNGFTYNFPWTFGSAASTAVWILPSNLTLGATRQLTLTNGTFDFNSFTVSAAGITILTGSPVIANTGSASLSTTLPITHTSGSLTLPFDVTTTAATGYTFTAGTLTLNDQILTTTVFSSSGSGTRTIAFGTSGQIALTGNNTTIFNFTTATGFTTTGTVYINCTYTGSTGTRTIVTGFTEAQASAGYNISFSGTTGIVLSSSATDTIALTGSFNNIDLTGFIGTLSNTARTIYGNLIIPSSGGTYTAGSNITTFSVPAGLTNTITSNGILLDFPLTVNSTNGGILQLVDNLTIGSNRSFTLTYGIIDINDRILSVGAFSSTNSNPRRLAFGSSGQLALTYGSTTNTFDVTNAVNFNTSGTVYINAIVGVRTGTGTYVTGFTEVQAAGYDIKTSGTTGFVINANAGETINISGNWNNFDLTGFTGILGNTARTIYGNVTIPASGGTYTAGTTATTLAAPTVALPGTNEYSVSFDGNADWIQTPGSSAFAIATSTTPFTVECWIYPTAAGGAIFTDQFTGSGDTIPIAITMSDGVTLSNTTGQTISFGAYNGSSWTVVGMANAAVTLNQWTHVACVFTGSGTKIFLNGVDSTSAGALSTWPVTGITGQLWYIGRRWDTSGTPYFTGYISNFRFVNGTAVYTSNFTPPTSPLTAIANTTLLTCQSNIFIDNSTNSFLITASGNAAVSALSPFNAATPVTQTITTNGRTLDFPIIIGTGTSNGITQLSDALTLGSTRLLTHTSGNFDLNDYTVTSLALSSTGSNNRVLSFANIGQLTLVGSNTTIINMATATNFGYSGTPKILSSYSAGTGTRTFALGNAAVFANTDVMFDFDIAGSNGIIIAGGTDSVAIVGQVRELDLRNSTNIITNTAKSVYGNFYTSSTGGTYSAGTAVTTLFGSSGNFTIDTANRALDFPLTINGNGNFTFANNYICGVNNISSTRALTLSTGNVNINDVTIFTGTFVSNTSNIRSLNFGNTGQISLAGSNASIVDMTIMTNFKYTGNSLIKSVYTGATGTRTFILGGTATSSGADPINIFPVSTTGNTGLVIGNTATDIVTLTGYFNDFDLTGYTRTLTNTPRTIYGNFIVPESGGTYTAGANTTTVSGYEVPVNNGYSVSCDGSDSFVIASTPILQLGTEDFEISCFINVTSISGLQIFYDQRNSDAAVAPVIYLSTNTIRYYTAGADRIISSPIINPNTWYHVTVSRVSNVTRLFVNGVQQGNDYVDNNNYIQSPLVLTSRYNNINLLIGFISNLIVNKGVGVTSVTVPTTPYTINANTVLLAFQDRDFVWKDNSVNNFSATITSDPTVGFYSPFTPSSIVAGAITTNNRTLDFPINIGNPNGGRGNVILNGNMTLGSTRDFSLTIGNLLLNNLVTTARSFNSNNLYERGISFDSTGEILVTGSNVAVINMAQATNFSYAGTPKITSNYSAGTGTRTFALGNAASFSNANCMFNFDIAGSNGIVISGGTDTLTVVGEVYDFDLRNTTNIITNSARNVYGNFLTSATGGTINAGTAATTFSGTTGNNVIDTEARTIQFPIIFNGVNGTWTLANNYVANATTAITLTNGQVDFNQKSITFANITVLTGNISLSNLTATQNIVHTSGNLTILSGAINSSTTGTYTITTGSLNLESPFSTGAFTHTAGNILLSNSDMTCTTFTSSGTGVRLIDFANSNINVTGTGTVVNMATITNLSANGTKNINITHSGNTAITVTPGTLTEANSINYNFTAGNYALTITAGNVNSLDFTGYSGTLGNTALTLFGNLVMSSAMTRTAGTAVYTFASTANQYITSNGVTFDFPVTINGINGNVILNDALTIGTSRLLTLGNGTIDLNNLTLSTGTFATSAGTKNITLNGGTLLITGSGATAFNNAVPAGFTMTKGNGNGTVSMSSATAKTFVGANQIYPCTLDNSGSANLTITGNNTFEVLKSSYVESTGNSNILIPSDGTTTVTVGIGTGVSNTQYFGIFGNTTAGRAELVYTGFGNIVADYITTRDVGYITNSWAETSNGSIPWRWYIGSNSINNGDMIGALLVNNDGNTAPILYHITEGSNFIIPSNWDSANNTIHMWGGGGGSAGSKTPAGGGGNIIGSSGGGGGGYTRVINFAASSGSNISFSIGEGGTAGVANTSNGGDGGTTTFSSYSANGGKGSTIIATGTSPGGLGGIGGTFNGGNGGVGGFTTNSANNSGGGGGGGAGGPNGNGGNGGNASITNANANTTSGGGGGASSGGTNGTAGSGATGGAGGDPNGGTGGSSGGNGSSGGFNYEIFNSVGSGGGSGAGGGVGVGASVGGNTIGGGAGGSGANDAGITRNGATGGAGGIIIVYYACTSPVFDSTSSMFLLF